MKKNKKAHLAGKSLRQFVGMKKSRLIKDTQKQKGFEGKSKSDVRNFIDNVGRFFDYKAQDRTSFGRAFLSTWRHAVDNVNDSAQQMLTEPTFVPVNTEIGLYPYDIIFLTMYARLMNNLTYEEEDELLRILAEMNSAWSLYFSIVKSRWPRLSHAADQTEQIRSMLQFEVQQLFFGDILPALTNRWKVPRNGLLNALELIEKEAKNDTIA